MYEYIINSGTFNFIVFPAVKKYYLLQDDALSANVMRLFLEARDIPYNQLPTAWFNYQDDETWSDFDGNERVLGRDLQEAELIDFFLLKKYNFGSLVAWRDTDTGSVKVFKREKLWCGISSPPT